MSRSKYSDDYDDPLEMGRWRGMVASAIKGRRGQRFLCELLHALDSMPAKELIRADEYEIVNEHGEGCALGSVAVARGWSDAVNVDSSEHDDLGARLDIASCLVQEIEFVNDGLGPRETKAERWKRVRRWAVRHVSGQCAKVDVTRGGAERLANG